MYASDGKTPLTSWTSWGESNAFGEPVHSYEQGLDGVVQTVASYTYDDLHRISKVTDQDNFTRSTTYDARGNIASTEDTTAAGILHWQYGYNDQGDIISIARQTPMGSSIISYGYDLLNNLSDYHCQGGRTGQSLCPVETDTLGLNRIRLGSSQPLHLQSQHYTFDAFNDIQTVLETLVTSDGKKANKRITYTYDPANLSHRLRLLHDQLQWDYGDGYGAAIKPADDLVYNADGQVIRDMNGDHLSYNDLGQMSAYQAVGEATSTTYAYDADGAQVRESAPHQAPMYKFYSGDALTLAVQAGSDGKQHTTSLRGAYHYVDGKVSEIFESGLNASVAAILSPAGKLTEQVSYTPYGVRSEMPTSKAMPAGKTSLPALLHNTTWGFNGQVTDTPTGYQLLGKGYRGYNPKLRRFMQHDVASPFGVGGMNGYAYVGNNPIMHTDPSGHGYQDDIDQGGAADEEAGPSNLAMSIAGTAAGVVGVIASAVFIGVIGAFSGGLGGVGAGMLASMMLGLGAGLAGAASGGMEIAGELLPALSGEQHDQMNQSALWLGLGASALSLVSIAGFGMSVAKTGIKGLGTKIMLGVMVLLGAVDASGMGLTSWGMAAPDEPPPEFLNITLMVAGVSVGIAGAIAGHVGAKMARGVKPRRNLFKKFIKGKPTTEEDTDQVSGATPYDIDLDIRLIHQKKITPGSVPEAGWTSRIKKFLTPKERTPRQDGEKYKRLSPSVRLLAQNYEEYKK